MGKDLRRQCMLYNKGIRLLTYEDNVLCRGLVFDIVVT